jgi:hypothetical protein
MVPMDLDMSSDKNLDNEWLFKKIKKQFFSNINLKIRKMLVIT